MNNIVYILGAGASAQSMPLVSDFNARLSLFLYELSNPTNKNYRGETKLDSDIKKLIADEENHYSIDTLAKKYWLADSTDEYNRVKALMTCFFIYEAFKRKDLELTKEKKDISIPGIPKESIAGSINTIDKRYDALLAAIATKSGSSLSLPSNISFVSWNYDDQLEYAAWNIENAGKEIKFLVPTKLINFSDGNDPLKPSLIKLNGSFAPNTTLFDDEKGELKSFINGRELNTKNINLLDKLYDKLLSNPHAINIQFAWEHSASNDKRLKLAKKKIEEATDIVIIGYSFPNYNVKVDQFIFGGNNRNLKNIYIEDISDNFVSLVDRLRYLKVNVDVLQKGGRIKHYPDLKTFCLPPSFFVEYPKATSVLSKKSYL
jgi:hypothetical protein